VFCCILLLSTAAIKGLAAVRPPTEISVMLHFGLPPLTVGKQPERSQDLPARISENGLHGRIRRKNVSGTLSRLYSENRSTFRLLEELPAQKLGRCLR
jgi:hypothetical protein